MYVEVRNFSLALSFDQIEILGKSKFYADGYFVI